jgi:hypothetical protein
MKKMFMNPYGGTVDSEENWRADFEKLKAQGTLDLWDSERFRVGCDMRAALEGYDPIRDSDLVEVAPDGSGGWRELQ